MKIKEVRKGRVWIYRAAKSIYSKRKGTSGLCECLEDALIDWVFNKQISLADYNEFLYRIPSYRLFTFDYLLDVFPEFNDLKDNIKSSTALYWWDIFDTKSRIGALDLMIKKAKEEK